MSSTQDKEPSKLLTVCPFILGNELGERMAYYGISTNFINYLKQLGASSASSAATVNAWSGFCYFFPVLGGWIADSLLGRFKTIFIFSVVYLIGSVVLTASAAIPGIKVEDGDKANTAQWMLLAIALLLLALGSGGLKPNVSSFGADQFDDNKERDRREKASFFNWFYLFINIGAFTASVSIVFVQDRGMWDIGFAIPAVILFVAVVLFFVGKPRYVMLPPSEYPLYRFFKIIGVAVIHRWKGYTTLPSDDDHRASPIDNRSTDTSFTPRERSQERCQERPHWLDWAITPSGFTADQVNEVKIVYRMFPIFLVSIIYRLHIVPFLVLQGNQMDRKITIFGSRFHIPSASLNIFNAAAILSLVPIYEFILLPVFVRCCRRRPKLLQRVALGFFLSVMQWVSFYFIELKRLRLYRDGRILEEEDGDIVLMSVLWQIIPYYFSGASEVFGAVALIEFFYDQAPDSMRSTMSAINLLGAGLSGYLTTLTIVGINGIADSFGGRWITDDLNKGHLDYYILVMMGTVGLAFLWFLWLAGHYQDKHKTQRGDASDGVDWGRSMEDQLELVTPTRM